MEDVTIRTAVLGDLVGLGDVFRRASLSNEGDRASLLANPEAMELDEAALHEGRMRVAVLGGAVVGFATLRQDDGTVDLEDLFVAPEHMRRGIARALVADAVGIVRAQGRTRLDLVANGHALPFYEAVGFVLDGPADTQFGAGHHMHLDV